MLEETIIYVIDDDEAVRDSLSVLLESEDFKLAIYSSATEFLKAHPSLPTDGCILTDVRMPGMDGLQLQRTLAEMGAVLPIIVMTGHGDVPIAVQALKSGAADFIQKPFTDDVLIAALRAALASNKMKGARRAQTDEIRRNHASLTPREKEVLEGLLVGHPNKTIGFDLGMSPRTVEVHRANIMRKMQAGSLSALVRMIMSIREE